VKYIYLKLLAAVDLASDLARRYRFRESILLDAKKLAALAWD
jgi:hypothetical protein